MDQKGIQGFCLWRKTHKRFWLLVQGWVKTREECESAEKVLDERSSWEGECVYVGEWREGKSVGMGFS